MFAVLATVTFAVFPDLPRVRPVSVVLNGNVEVDNVEAKLVDDGSIVSVPVPVNKLVEVLGASLRMVIEPPLIVVAPAYDVVPVKTRAFVPDFVSAPEPEMLPAKVTESLRLNVSVPSLTTLPERTPAVEPAPMVMPPAEIVVPPVWLLVPVNESTPAPSLVTVPVPEIAPE